MPQVNGRFWIEASGGAANAARRAFGRGEEATFNAIAGDERFDRQAGLGEVSARSFGELEAALDEAVARADERGILDDPDWSLTLAPEGRRPFDRVLLEIDAGGGFLENAWFVLGAVPAD